MIDRSLPPLNVPSHYAIANICEDFAFTYLAKYSGAGLSSRCQESLQRAYAPTFFGNYARVNGGRPAYCMATWATNGGPRITIAIEGQTSFAQLSDVSTGLGAATHGSFPGNVYGAFLTHALTIKAELLANNNFLNVYNRPGCLIKFTGFSLGAAMAHVLCKLMTPNAPGKFYAVRGFATPRVGTAAFQGSFPSNIPLQNIYCGADRIDVIPFCTANGRQFITTAWTDPIVNYAPTLMQERWRTLGDPVNVDQDVTFSDFVRVARQRDGPYNSENPWTWHDYDYYRYMLTSRVQTAYNHAMWRFQYLEYNDDNSWGQKFGQSSDTPSFCKGIVVPNPDDFVTTVQTPEEAVAIQQQHLPPVRQQPMIQAIPGMDGGRRATGTWEPRRVRDY